MPFLAAQRPASGERARDKRHALIQLHVGADRRRLPDHHSGAVIDEKMAPDLRPGMNIDPGAAMGPFRHHAGDEGEMGEIENVGHALDCNRLERRIGEDDFLEAGRGRIALVSGVDISPEHFAHARELAKEMAQDAISLRIHRSGVSVAAAGETFAHLRMHAGVEGAHAAAGQRGQIARMHDCLAMKTGEEQAEQFDTSVIDRRARRERRGGIEIIDPAIRAVSAQQRLSRVIVHCFRHRRNISPTRLRMEIIHDG